MCNTLNMVIQHHCDDSRSCCIGACCEQYYIATCDLKSELIYIDAVEINSNYTSYIRLCHPVMTKDLQAEIKNYNPKNIKRI